MPLKLTHSIDTGDGGDEQVACPITDPRGRSGTRVRKFSGLLGHPRAGARRQRTAFPHKSEALLGPRLLCG